MLNFTDKHMAENMRKQHVKMCHLYRMAQTLAEAESLYHGLKARWVSTGAVTEKTLSNWSCGLPFGTSAIVNGVDL